MFCAFELLDSFLSSPSTSIHDSSATARLLSICELPLLATAAAAFSARLFVGSESGGISTSFNSCGAVYSPAVLPTSSRLLAFLCAFFRDCLVQHLSSSIQALRSFWSCFETFLDFDSALELPQTALVVWQRVNLCYWPVHVSILPSTSLHGPPITLLMASLFHLSCCSVFLASRALTTPLAVQTKHSALLFLPPSHTPNLYLGFILFNGSENIGLARPSLRMVQFLVLAFLPGNLSNGVRPSRPFWHLDKMLSACSTNHGKTKESSRSSSWGCGSSRGT